MTISTVEAYDAAWPGMARKACEELRQALPGVFLEIEHVGSTAVPGLAAKPVIDLMASAASLPAMTPHRETLAGLGYVLLEGVMHNRLFYPRDDASGRRTHHLHVVSADTWETRNERLLRDYLRAHPEAAARYGALKERLAATLGVGDEYTKAKTGLIQEMVDAARASRGLPLVDVWEG
ncbi:GrpB family protein [Flindersiella endophytica]